MTATTYETATAYMAKRPAFTSLRQIEVTNATALKNAITNLRAGDYIKATSKFTVNGQTIFAKNLTSPAVLDLGDLVTFANTSGLDSDAVYIKKANNLRIYGGNVTTGGKAGGGILVHGATSVLWWGANVYDCGQNGYSVFTATDGGPVSGCDFEGTITNCGTVWTYDPHKEKGSGYHGANLDDSGIYPFYANRFAFDIYHQHAGAGVEYGSNKIPCVRNTLIVRAYGLSYVSKIQTGGNAIQTWGVAGQSLTVPFIEVTDAQGHAFWTGGMFSGADCTGMTVEYGRATNTCLNPRYALDNTWDARKGVVYKDVQPPPKAGKA